MPTGSDRLKTQRVYREPGPERSWPPPAGQLPALQNDASNLLPETPGTRGHLVLPGRTMRDDGPGRPANPGNSNFPAICTYFGQIVDHVRIPR